MRNLSSKLRKATAWLLALGMTMSAIQPTFVYANMEPPEPDTESTADPNPGGDGNTGSASVDLQDNEDNSSILDVKTSNTKDIDQVVRLHLWEFDEGFFEDYDFTKTPLKDVTVNGLDTNHMVSVDTKTGNLISLTYTADEENRDYYLEFTATAQSENEFSIQFEAEETLTDAKDFVVEPEIMDSSETDTASDPVKLNVKAAEIVADTENETIESEPAEPTTETAAEAPDAESNAVISEDVNTASEENKCGENAYWTLEEETLVISGTGPMYDYTYDFEAETTTAPWYVYADNIHYIQIDDGITYIGDNAFAFMLLNSIVIPDSVTEIGENILMGSYIKNVTLPFVGRSEHDKTGFEATLAYLFGDMRKVAEETGISESALESSYIKAYHTYDGYTADAFDATNKDSYTYIYINQYISLSVNVTKQTEFPDFAFSGVILESITLPSETNRYSNYMFYNTTASSLLIPETVTLEPHALAGMLVQVLLFDKDNPLETLTHTLLEGTICIALSLPSSLKTIDGEGTAFDFAYNGQLYLLQPDLKQFYELDFINGAKNFSSAYYINSTSEIGSRNPVYVTNYGVPEGTVKIGENSLSGSDITSIVLPGTVTEIGKNAFKDCSQLQSINLENVVSIGESAFSGCSALNNITLNPGLGNLQKETFKGCASLSNIHLPETITEIPDGLFNGCISLSEINITESVQTIGKNAFKGSGLTSVEIPASVQQIKENAFADSVSLMEVNGESTVEGVGNTLPNTMIADNAFYNTGLIMEDASLGKLFVVEKDGLTVTVVTDESKNRTPSIDEADRLLYYTGETATTTISISNPNGAGKEGNVIRILLNSSEDYKINMEEGSFHIEVGSTTYTGEIIKTSQGYTVEIEAPGDGDTISFSIGSTFASGSTGGGLALIGAEIVGKDGSSKVSEGAQYLSWGTHPDPYPVNKKMRDTWSLTGSGLNDGISYINGLSYTITAARSGDTLEGIGEDPLTSLVFTDALTIPDGWYISDEVKDAINNGKLTYNGKEVLLGDRTILQITTSNNISISSVSLSDDGTKLIVKWSSTSAKAYEYVLTYGDKFIATDTKLEPEQKIDITNDITADEFYTYSAPQNQESSVTASVTTSEGSIDLTYELNVDTYDSNLRRGKAFVMGTDAPYQITLHNPGVTSTYVGELSDSLPRQFYISGEGIESMFNSDTGDALELTITNGTITTGNSVYDVTGYDGGSYKTSIDHTWSGSIYEGLSQPDEDSYTNDYASNNGVTITFQKGNDCIVMTYNSNMYTIGENCYYKSVDEALNSINFKNTYYTQYSVVWDFDDDNREIYSGETIVIDIPAIAKSTFMMLTKDALGMYDTDSYTIRNGQRNAQSNSTAQLKYAGGNDYYKTSSVTNLYYFMDMSIDLEMYENGKAVDEDTVIKEGSVSEYRNEIELAENQKTEQIPLVNQVEATQVLMVPVNENKGADWASDAEVYTAEDGTQYYLLSKEGTYKDVHIGQLYSYYDNRYIDVIYKTPLDNKVLVADRITVEKTDNGLKSTIYWYIEKLDQINYRVLTDAPGFVYTPDSLYLCYNVLNSGKYSESSSRYYNNTAYLGDYQGHRLVDSFGGVSFDIEKNIVTEVGDTETVNNNSTIGEGDTVTYRLTMYSTIDHISTVTGSEMSDILPLNIDSYRWTKDNVKISYSGFEYISDFSGDAWTITEAQGNTNQQNIKWDDDFIVTFNEPAYIWVTLTYPEGTQWEQYLNAYNSTNLTNTFKVDGPTNLQEYVSHVLKQDTEVLLQKGVYATGSISDTSDDNNAKLKFNTGSDTRYYYPNSTSDKAFVAYYVVLYNQGKSNLYLTNMTDTLPDGYNFEYFATSRLDSNKRYMDANDFVYFKSIMTHSRVIAVTPNSEQYAFATITDSQNGDVKYVPAKINSTQKGNTVTFSFSSNGDKNLASYDETVGLSYLKPGESIQFAYVCSTDSYDKTQDISNNAIAMPIYNRTGGNISIGDSKINVYDTGADANDGGCTLISGEEAAAKGFTDQADDTQWVMSDVNVYRGGIKPGLSKKLVNAESPSGMITQSPVVVNPTDTLEWDVTAHNSGNNGIVDYTITDELPSPYVFSGDVYYNIYGSADKMVAASSSNDGEDTPLFTIENVKIDDSGLVESMEIHYKTSPSHEEEAELIVNGDPIEASTQWTYKINVDFYNLGGFNLTTSADYTISAFYNDEGKLQLSVEFKDDEMGIPSNGYGVLTLHTENSTNTYVNKTYTNTAYMTPIVQIWDGNVNIGNYEESGPTAALADLPSVRNSAPFTVANGYATTSKKVITENENPENTAASDDGKNYIVIEDASKQFTYTLSVNNVSNRAMDKLILIDNLPQVGDHDTFSPNEERESEFTVSLMDNPNFTVTVAPDSSNATWTERTLTPDQYLIQYSAKTEFDTNDWSGFDAGWTTYQDGADLSGARSIRLVILDDEGTLIPANANIKLTFAAKADENAKAGEYAWNSFGYHYSMVNSETELEAAPLEVGVAITGKPIIYKSTVDEDGNPAVLEEDTTYRYILYKGHYMTGIDGTSTVDDVVSALKEEGTEFSYIELKVPAGKTVSAQLSLADIYAYDYSGADGFTATDTAWTWENDASYTLWEIPSENYTFDNVNGGETINNAYTFTYTNTRNQTLECVNELVPTTFDIRVNKYYSEEVGDTTYTGAVEGAVLQVWNADKSEMIDEQTVDETGYVTFAELEAGDYILVEAEAPDHFVTANDISFTVNKDGTITTENSENIGTDDDGMFLKMKDEMEDGTITIRKYEDDGKTPLAGVTYNLYDADDQVVDTKTTGEDGTVTFTDIPFGDYTIVETATASGYNLLTDPINVTIPLVLTSDEADEKNADTTQAFYDKDTDSYIFLAMSYDITDDATFVMPTAGGNNFAVMALGGMGALIFLAGAWIMYRRKKGFIRS